MPLHAKRYWLLTSETLQEAMEEQYLKSLLGCLPRLPMAAAAWGPFAYHREANHALHPASPQSHSSLDSVRAQVKTSLLLFWYFPYFLWMHWLRLPAFLLAQRAAQTNALIVMKSLS